MKLFADLTNGIHGNVLIQKKMTPKQNVTVLPINSEIYLSKTSPKLEVELDLNNFELLQRSNMSLKDDAGLMGIEDDGKSEPNFKVKFSGKTEKKNATRYHKIELYYHVAGFYNTHHKPNE